MSNRSDNRPAEVFGYPVDVDSQKAQDAREQYLCPFMGIRCTKKSRLLDYPFGVCSIQRRDIIQAICPRRFEEEGTMRGVSRVLQDIAVHYFGDFDNVIPFAEVRLPHVGAIDYVLVRHKVMQAEVDDFVCVELQTDQTTSTGALVQAVKDVLAGEEVGNRTYPFGMNTYDTIKRSMTQLFNKGIVYESWGVKCYWVFQEYIYENLVRRYGLKQDGYISEQASRFALYDLKREGDVYHLEATRYVSTSVDEMYQSMRNNPGLPHRDDFVQVLNRKLQAHLKLKFG